MHPVGELRLVGRIRGVAAIVGVCLAASVAGAAPPNGRFANSGDNGIHCAPQPEPGLVIDAANVANYGCFLPAAVIFAVKHGFRIRIGGPHQLEWPAGFRQATEKYSPQVRLDDDDNLAGYVAGMPFPLVKIDDPRAARKIAYNWHMGPFMPDDFSLAPWVSFGYSDSANGTAHPVYGEPDYTFVCDHFDFLRFAHRTEKDPRPTLGDNAQGFEWKARCTNWNLSAQSAHGAQSLWLRFLNPRYDDESVQFEESTRRIRRIPVSPPYLDHHCRSCHQPYWAYALPKTEAYSYRFLGTTPILACLTADDEPAGFVGRDPVSRANLLAGTDKLAMGEEPFEMRSAYIIEAIPVDDNFKNLVTLIWIDTETYVWLGAEFFESNLETEAPELQEVAAPLWRTSPAPEGGVLFDLAGSFYVPLAYQPTLPADSGPGKFAQSDSKRWFFRSLVPSHGPFDQRINTGATSEAIFNPRSLGN